MCLSALILWFAIHSCGCISYMFGFCIYWPLNRIVEKGQIRYLSEEIEQKVSSVSFADWAALRMIRNMLHVAALSTVLARLVFSTYPNCPSWVRDFIHVIVYPRMAEFSGEPVFSPWAQQGSNNRPGVWYVPNHIVTKASPTPRVLKRGLWGSLVFLGNQSH